MKHVDRSEIENLRFVCLDATEKLKRNKRSPKLKGRRITGMEILKIKENEESEEWPFPWWLLTENK